jgi:hypothetical protein
VHPAPSKEYVNRNTQMGCPGESVSSKHQTHNAGRRTRPFRPELYNRISPQTGPAVTGPDDSIIRAKARRIVTRAASERTSISPESRSLHAPCVRFAPEVTREQRNTRSRPGATPLPVQDSHLRVSSEGFDILIRSTHHPPSPGLSWRTFRGNFGDHHAQSFVAHRGPVIGAEQRYPGIRRLQAAAVQNFGGLFDQGQYVSTWLTA